MKEIQLTKGFVALVDDEDYERINAFKWYAKHINGQKHNAKIYGQRVSPKQVPSRETIAMHRFVMGCTKGDGTTIDHKDRNGLNNQRDNLRIATHSQNGQNRGKTSQNTSGFKGVCWNKVVNKWQAFIYHKKKYKCLGYFEDITKAAEAYDRAAILHFGEYAKLNFPHDNVA